MSVRSNRKTNGGSAPLRARLVDARKAKTLVARLLANADGELKRLR